MYKTSDINLATFLITKGYPIESISSSQGRKVFEFEEGSDESLRGFEKEFFNRGEASLVLANDLLNNFKSLKDRMHNQL